MAATDALIGFLDELLDPGAFDDMGPNGLQVPGAREVRRVVTGVTAQRAPNSCSCTTACSGTSSRSG
jgi:putative NIF3 family GTP cyclohydrolase 1 type 2